LTSLILAYVRFCISCYLKRRKNSHNKIHKTA